MKKLILFTLLLCFLLTINAQVTEVKYVIEINDATNNYDCKLIVEEGSATSAVDRTQFNSQFVIVVPTGTVFSFVESFNPLLDNQMETSTTPTDWELINSAIAPSEQPESDFYAYAPNISNTAQYNSMTMGSYITLFSISAQSDCNFEIRPLDNIIDPVTIGFNSFMQGFTIGGIDQIYNGNELPSSTDADVDITLEGGSICEGECYTLAPNYNCVPLGTTYIWSTGETSETITVCPENTQNYFVTWELPNGWNGEVEAAVIVDGDAINTGGITDLCQGSVVFFEPASEGWSSSDPTIVTVEEGIVEALSPGVVTLTYSSAPGCSDQVDIEVQAIPQIFVGSDALCIGETMQVLPAEGTWTSGNTAVATITNDGTVTAVSGGAVVFLYTSLDGVCEMIESDVVIVEEDPIVSIDSNQIEINGSASLNPSTGGIWVSNNTSVATVTPFGLVTGISCGTVSFTYTNTFTGCSATVSDVMVGSDLTIDISGPNLFCIGQEVVLTASGDIGNEYLWIAPDGSIVGDSPQLKIESFNENQQGTYIVVATGDSGCVKNESWTLSLDPNGCEDPCEETSAEWAYVPAGNFDADYNIITYATAPNLLAIGGRDHLVFYDYITGNVYLKENNGNGFLDNEILLFYNDDHYANGGYEIYLEDIDNDGLTDIVLAAWNIVSPLGDIGDRLSVYHNLGGGDFALQIDEQVCGMAGPNNLRVVDFDKDGIKDIFFVCVDYLYDILWINAWDDVELTNFNKQQACNIFTGDFNDDGLVDIGLNSAGVLLNNGNRTFTELNMDNYDPGCLPPIYFVEETNTLLDAYFAFQIIDPVSLETEMCSDHLFGDNENEIFRAFINSPDKESIIIPQVEGFYNLDPNQQCDWSIDGDGISNVVARQNTKIDLTLNGCTDFLVLDGENIYAWINPKQSNKILGTAFIDENADGIYDSNELPLRNVWVSIEPGDLSVLTDDDGNYIFSVPEGTYTISAEVNDGDWIQDVLIIDNIEISDPCNEGYNFGFVPSPTPEETATISMVNTIARCDFETKFTITVENTGTEPLDGVLAFSFDEETTFFSSDIDDYQLSGNTLTANIGPLAPFSPQTYVVTLKMPSGSSNLPLLAFDTKLYDKFGELIEEYGYTDQLRCSYDPNDKREFPDREGEDNLTLMDEDIEYVIRFQNNGNDTAFQVKIVDQLDPNIEPSSVRVINSSHDVETCLEGRNLVFLFEDILLVDSTTNYPASQGYVTFRCNAKDGRMEFTPVRNHADIIFDTNEPIITNETINTLVTSLCSNKDTLLEATICEGEIYEGHMEPGTYTEVFELPFGCDSVVTIILEVEGIEYTQQDIETCAGSSLLIGGNQYDIEESMTIIDTIINDNGCISHILTFEIEAISDILGMPEDIDICNNESISLEFEIEGTWMSNDESVIIVDGNVLTTVGPGSTTLTFTDNALGCTDELTVNVYPVPTLENIGSSQICINGSTSLTADAAGTWISDDSTIATIDDEGVVTGNAEGNVSLIFTDEETGCSSSLSLEILPLSDPLCTVSTDELDQNIVKLYPNPAIESVYIETEEEWQSVRIVNILGETMADLNQTNANKIEMDVSQYASGVYLVMFKDGDKSLTKRFVVR